MMPYLPPMLSLGVNSLGVNSSSSLKLGEEEKQNLEETLGVEESMEEEVDESIEEEFLTPLRALRRRYRGIREAIFDVI